MLMHVIINSVCVSGKSGLARHFGCPVGMAQVVAPERTRRRPWSHPPCSCRQTQLQGAWGPPRHSGGYCGGPQSWSQHRQPAQQRLGLPVPDQHCTWSLRLGLQSDRRSPGQWTDLHSPGLQCGARTAHWNQSQRKGECRLRTGSFADRQLTGSLAGHLKTVPHAHSPEHPHGQYGAGRPVRCLAKNNVPFLKQLSPCRAGQNQGTLSSPDCRITSISLGKFSFPHTRVIASEPPDLKQE